MGCNHGKLYLLTILYVSREGLRTNYGSMTIQYIANLNGCKNDHLKFRNVDVFCSKHKKTSTNNYGLRAKIRKNVYHCKTSVLLYKSGI